jgi:serine/threonine protein kinase
MTFEVHRMADEDPAPATSQTHAQGKILDRKYLIEDVLGCGGMSIVYKAKHLGFDRTVALKFLTCIINEASAMERFKREAIVLNQLKHPNIIELVGWGFLQRRPYIAMEWVDGQSLAQTLRSHPNNRLSASEATPIFLQICDALEHAHSKGIIHRDLNPSNVMLTGQQQVKLIDFGIARLTDSAGVSMSTLISTGAIIGSLPYMSPEQCTGHPPDVRSDIYSMGCLMYEVLTGSPPFTSDNANTMLMQHVQQKPKNHAELNNWLGKIVMSALAKDPSARIESAARLRQLISDQAAPQQPRVSALQILAGLIMSISALLVIAAVYAFISLCITQNQVQQLHDKYESLHTRYHDSLANGIRQMYFPDDLSQFENARQALIAVPNMSNQETPDDYVTIIAWETIHAARYWQLLRFWSLASYVAEQPHIPHTPEYAQARQDLEQRGLFLMWHKYGRNWPVPFLEAKFRTLLSQEPSTNAGRASDLRMTAIELGRHYHALGRLNEEITVLEQALSTCEQTMHTVQVGHSFRPGIANLELNLANAYLARAKTHGTADLLQARAHRDACIASCKDWQSYLPNMINDKPVVSLNGVNAKLNGADPVAVALNEEVVQLEKQAEAMLPNDARR